MRRRRQEFWFCVVAADGEREIERKWEDGRGRPPTDARSRGQCAVVAALGGVVAWRLRLGSATWRNSRVRLVRRRLLPSLGRLFASPPMRSRHGLYILLHFD